MLVALQFNWLYGHIVPTTGTCLFISSAGFSRKTSPLPHLMVISLDAIQDLQRCLPLWQSILPEIQVGQVDVAKLLFLLTI